MESFSFCRCYNIVSVKIPDSVQTIGDYCFGWDSQITSFELGKNISNVEPMAFHMDSSEMKYIVIQSDYVAKKLTTQSSIGKLVKYGVLNIYIKEDIKEIGSYIMDNYTKQVESDKEGYIKYVKNT